MSFTIKNAKFIKIEKDQEVFARGPLPYAENRLLQQGQQYDQVVENSNISFVYRAGICDEPKEDKDVVLSNLLSTSFLIVLNEKLEIIHDVVFPHETNLQNVLLFTKELCGVTDDEVLEMYKVIVTTDNICKAISIGSKTQAQVVVSIVATGTIPQIPANVNDREHKELPSFVLAYDLADLLEEEDKALADLLRTGQPVRMTNQSKALIRHPTVQGISDYIDSLTAEYDNLDKRSFFVDKVNIVSFVHHTFRLQGLIRFSHMFNQIVRRYNQYLKKSPASVEMASLFLRPLEFKQQISAMLKYNEQIHESEQNTGCGPHKGHYLPASTDWFNWYNKPEEVPSGSYERIVPWRNAFQY
ncbi:unnamed protein product [Bursaphelenchus okinawaensis]|uniref:Uncharacterized protein n=1 Tax=Bursaphelenchus okinawaensis TaxID=465554 RepID=A0A811K1Y4_9BILA|nr:unnamed protein product [Bursaphelenchus okinawaensis]CAG9090118.1 unnamed protein product [Bursaphelenchus okinawaensis]